MKLYGKDLDKELEVRKEAKDKRRDEKKTFRDKAKEKGITPSEYLDWESGKDICSHEEYKKTIVGIHKPYLLIEMCVKCKDSRVIAKIETEEDCEKYKDDLEEALINAGMIKKGLE